MDKPIGEVIHYFDKINVAVIKLLQGPLKVGDKIKITTRDGEFEQEVESMQVEHEQINSAKKGDEFGLKVKEKVKEGDEVFRA